MSIFGSDKTFPQPINWTTSFFIGAFYGGAVAALFFFTWKAFAVAVVLWWVAGSRWPSSIVAQIPGMNKFNDKSRRLVTRLRHVAHKRRFQDAVAMDCARVLGVHARVRF